MTFLAGRALPWFALGSVLVLGVVAFDGTTEAFVVLAGMVVLIAACIRYTVLAVRDDPLRPLIVARRGLMVDGGGVERRAQAARAATGRGRRARARRDAL